MGESHSWNSLDRRRAAALLGVVPGLMLELRAQSCGHAILEPQTAFFRDLMARTTAPNHFHFVFSSTNRFSEFDREIQRRLSSDRRQEEASGFSRENNFLEYSY